MKRVLVLFTLCVLAAFAQAQISSFPLSSVRLLNSPFKQAQETDLKYILELDPDRLLVPFLKEAGIKTDKESYGNWENTGLDGHIGGHYISALANMYASTADPEAGKRLSYMISWLDSCQKKIGTGYVGGIPSAKKLWAEIANGQINATAFSLNGSWVPWYNLHKTYAGLIDAYLLTGNKKAKSILVKLADWNLALTSKLSDAQLQQMLGAEHGGMNEALADVAAITGNKKYLKEAKRYSHHQILDPLVKQEDRLNGLHANTQIPKVIGFMRIASLGGPQPWEEAASFFWNTVVENRTVSIGGNSVREHFHPSSDFSSMIDSKEGPETCNSYNMLKLSKQLFLAHPKGSYIDYYERTLYNHILSSQHPNGGFVYFTPMRPRHYRVYSQPETSFWCCVGSGMENHGKYGELIYAHNKQDIFVNLFIPSTLQWKEKGISLTQETAFPFEESSRIKLKLNKPATFSLNVRIPSWVKKDGMVLWVNDKKVNLNLNANSYASIRRQWKTGDRIRLKMPMQTKAEILPDGSSWVSYVHGPLVLAAATDTSDLFGLHADGSRMGHVANGPSYALDEAPVILASKAGLNNTIKAVHGKPLTFSVSQSVYPDKYKNLELIPFFQLHDARYVIYWPFSAKEDLEKRKQALQQSELSKLALEALTIDAIAPGEQQPEAEHNFKGENTETGMLMDRRMRTSTSWFSYDLRNKDNEACKLRITYSGTDMNKNFDIFLGEELLKTVKLDGSQGAGFFEEDYVVPEKYKREKNLKLKFVAHSGSVAGGIFGIRLLKCER